MTQKELIKISGIGPKYAQTLFTGGVTSLAELAASTPEKLAAIVDPPAWRVPDFADWIRQARTLTEPEDDGGSVPAVEPEPTAGISEVVSELSPPGGVEMSDSLPGDEEQSKIEAVFDDIDVELEEAGDKAAVVIEPPAEEVIAEVDAAADDIDTALAVEIEEIMDADEPAEPVAAAPVIEISEKPPVTTTSSTMSTSPPPPLEVVPAATRESGGGFLRDLLLIAIGGLLGAGIALGGLYFLNGTLDFARHERFQLLDSKVSDLDQGYTALSGRVDAGAAAVEALDTDLGDTFAAVDTLGEQIGAVDQEVTLLHGDVQTLSAQDAEFVAEFETVGEQIDGLNVTAGRFDTFAVGLRNLADAIAGPESVAPAIPITPTEEITVTEPISVTEPLTKTEEMTATETITATEPITSSEEIAPAEADAALEAQADSQAISNSPALVAFPALEPILLPEPGQSHIFGLVWEDDGDGVPEAGEVAIPAVKITLKNGDGDEIATATTDENGRFFFPNLDPGTYIITETDPDDLESVTPNTVTVTTSNNGVMEINFADGSP